MTLLSAEDAQEWLKVNGWPENLRHTSFPIPHVDFVIPAHSCRKTALAYAISSHYADEAEVLLLIKDWDIRPDCASMFLFDRVRESSGDPRNIEQAPGHRLSGSENDWIQALLAIVFYFAWEALLIDDKGKQAVWISHDEWISLHSRDQAYLDSLSNYFESTFGLERR